MYDEKFGLLSISLGLPSFRALQHWNERERKRILAVSISSRSHSHCRSEACERGSFSKFYFRFPFNFCHYTLTHWYIHTSIFTLNVLTRIPSFPFFELKFIDFQSIPLCECVFHMVFNSLKRDKYFIWIGMAKFSGAQTHIPFNYCFMCAKQAFQITHICVHKHRLLFFAYSLKFICARDFLLWMH